jgi:TetR/AcrR family fatty acid metabolism transcriptional regulator
MNESSFSGVDVGVGPRRTDKRALITEAAVEVFAEKGFHSARVSDIARKAGVADGTIYLYFKNKEDLLLSIFEEKMDVLLDGMHASLDGVVDPMERIRLFARHHFLQVRENRSSAEVLQVELRLSNKFLKEYRPEKLWAYLDIFASAVRDGQAKGLFREDINPFIAMWGFFGGLDEIAMQWVLARDQRRIPLEQAADQVANIYIRGMRTQTQIQSEDP